MNEIEQPRLRKCKLLVVPGVPHTGEVIRLERKIELGHQRFYYFDYVVGPVSGSGRHHK